MPAPQALIEPIAGLLASEDLSESFARFLLSVERRADEQVILDDDWLVAYYHRRRKTSAPSMGRA